MQCCFILSETVLISNGALVVRNSQLYNSTWEIQSCKLFSDSKMLVLQHFDVIPTYNWLEWYSLMTVIWGANWLAIPIEGYT
jgi:hypothetical protein